MSNRVEEAWDKAAACQARAQATTDGKLKAVFLKLRESWLRIANNAQFQDDVTDSARGLWGTDSEFGSSPSRFMRRLSADSS